ncbi:transporter substrate-binding domain-containing protein [Rhizobium leguminosarum]|jgi:polar amino acid transport system substrate-binding protein|uniref:Transporter substrate-binding domain-containing protein n=2 Tax=Rhizobium TaxID=379 RepID=A0A444I6Q5_RHILE|nr:MULTISPECIES: transporter substrate-binding domain-containing protein [Rhizobium]MBY5460632.1 transporter substrate-binding domain-containing protein [Rhizobium leguminosarum]RWX13810.1 transporter substrate-binding domain-containing protein [Rhizobium leguminosarum]RWX33989.1 transporter substrate-binding domain-containing protein [Rhizobium leguminosarum]TBC54785.1 transporter substrate-binding domain-containing protein [Rhizobium leguminosarum]TBC86717.1 transporter substrate-binding dom
MSSAKFTKLYFGLALSICALTSTQSFADATLDRIKGRGKLTVGVILSGAPFGYIDPKTQAQKGFNLDIAQALADDLGVKLETVTVTPPNRVQFLQQGKVDILIANMQYTEERAKILDYVPTPYDRSGGAAVVRKDSGLKDWADLKGKPVCVSQGSNYTQPLIEEFGAAVKALPSQPESLLALQGGNCVAAVHVGATVGLLLQDRPEEWKDYAIPFPTELIPSDSVIWLRKGEKDTQAALDAGVKMLHVSGKLLEFARINRLPNTEYLQQQNKVLSASK